MQSALQLTDSRVDRITLTDSAVRVHFSFACILKSRGQITSGHSSLWGQEAEMVVMDAAVEGKVPVLPDTVVDGELDVGSIAYDLVPASLRSRVAVTLVLEFSSGERFIVHGRGVALALLGEAMFLEASD